MSPYQSWTICSTLFWMNPCYKRYLLDIEPEWRTANLCWSGWCQGLPADDCLITDDCLILICSLQDSKAPWQRPSWLIFYTHAKAWKNEVLKEILNYACKIFILITVFLDSLSLSCLLYQSCVCLLLKLFLPLSYLPC